MSVCQSINCCFSRSGLQSVTQTKSLYKINISKEVLTQADPSAEVTSNSFFNYKVLQAHRLRASTASIESFDFGKNTVSHIVEPGCTVLVAGSTGGVGQLVTARLLERGYFVKALTRDAEKAKFIFGDDQKKLKVIIGDLRDEDIAKEATKDVHAICSCIGTTAFPSGRWNGNNTTEMTDKIAAGNLIKNAPSNIRRFVFVSSTGVTRCDKFPFSILNFFKVLTYKQMSEQVLMESGLPYTILRPSRLTDGPYTSYDLNTLIKGTRGVRFNVLLSMNDDLSGEVSRIAVAEAIVQCLMFPETVGHAYNLQSVVGDGPEQDSKKWEKLFVTCSV